MKLPNNYAEIPESTDIGARPAPGAYICKVVRVQDAISKSDRAMLIIDFDIDCGPFANFFANENDARSERNLDQRWLRFYQVYDGKSVGLFKKLLKDFDRSNDSFSAPEKGGVFDEQSLIGLRLGLLCDGEEYEYNNKIFMSLKPKYAFDTQQVIKGNVPQPRIRGVDGVWRDANEPRPPLTKPGTNELAHVNDIDIPF